MRKIDILNKNYEVANLNTVVYEGYSIKEIIEDSPVFDVTPPQHYLDYWQKIYDYLKDGTQLPGHTYIPSGQSKYDIAYINKTIDDPMDELNGYTLREVFENGNLYTLGQKTLNQYAYDSQQDVTLIENHYYYVNRIAENISPYVPSNDQFGRITVLQPAVINLLNTNKVIGFSSGIRQFLYPTQVNISLYFYGISGFDGTNTSIFKDIHLIDLNTFGLQAKTYTDIDYYYSLYQARKSITKKSLTYADIFELFERSVNGNFNNNENGWTFGTNITVHSVVNGQLTFTGGSRFIGGSGARWVRNIDGALSVYGEKYYFAFTAKRNNSILENIFATSLGYYNVDNFVLTTSMLPYSSIKNSITDNSDITFGADEGLEVVVDDIHVVSIGNFDELITKEQLDLLLAHYLLVKDIVIYPENFLPLDPTGFGNRYKFKELNTKVYGHEMDFEKMQLNLLFGTYRNAYESFNLIMNFMINNEAIISYNYGKGERYTDVRLINAPKTELEPGNIMRNKFEFKRLTPFYTLIYGDSSIIVQNNHDWDLKPVVEGTVSTNIVYVEMEDQITGLVTSVKFDFTVVSKPFTFKYNCETKEILINGTNSGYAFIDQSYGVSFLSIPKGNEHFVSTIGITNPKITIKKWVID